MTGSKSQRQPYVSLSFLVYDPALPMAPISFLRLPGELRNEIYAYIFNSLPEQLHHPWDDGRSCGTYLSLFLTCRQIYSEASSLLWEDHIQNMTLHFDNGRDFESFMQQYLTRWPQLRSARFSVRIIVFDNSKLAEAANELVPILPLLLPLPDYQLRGAERRRSSAINTWKWMLRSAHKYRVVECTDCGDESDCVTYRAAESCMGEPGLTKTFFTWDNWLNKEDGVASTKDADLHAAMQLDCRIESLQNSSALETPPSVYDRARSKVTSECVIIEGRIGDVKLPNLPTDQLDPESVENGSNPREIRHLGNICSSYIPSARRQ